MRVGDMFFGEIEKVDGQSIQTQFFVLGLPITPKKTMFVIKEDYNGVEGFEMPKHSLSVSMGYVRMWSLGLTSGVGVFGMMDENQTLLIIAGLLAVVCIATSFFVGKTKAEDKHKRRALGKLLSINAFPDWLPDTTVSSLYNNLLAQYELVRGELGGKAWQDYLKNTMSVPDAHAPLMYALATYNHQIEQSNASESLKDKAVKFFEALPDNFLQSLKQ